MSVAAARKELEDARSRQTELEERLQAAGARVEELQDDYGAAVARDSGDADTLRQQLHEATAEREGLDRGLSFLLRDIERLEGELASAEAEEAAERLEARLSELREVARECGQELRSFLEDGFLELARRREAAVEAAIAAEREFRGRKRDAGESGALGRRGEILEARGAHGAGDIEGAVIALRVFAEGRFAVAEAFRALLTRSGHLEEPERDKPESLRDRVRIGAGKQAAGS